MPAEDEELLEVGEEVPEEGHAALEKKYREQMRQIVSQKIELPISTLPDMIKEQVNLSPDFQRRGRWDQEQQSRFIESIIMNVPIARGPIPISYPTRIVRYLRSFLSVVRWMSFTNLGPSGTDATWGFEVVPVQWRPCKSFIFCCC